MAEIKFRPYIRKSPVDKSIKYYAMKVSYSNISTDELCKRITANTAVPAGVVKAAAVAIQDSIANFVMNGHSVKLGNFMSIRPTLLTRGVTEEANFTADRIYKVMLRCSWGSDVLPMQDPENYVFTRVGEIASGETP